MTPIRPTHAEREHVREAIQAAVTLTHGLRSTRTKAGLPFDEMVAHELADMLVAVREHRPDVTLEQVRKIDAGAAGHSDYAAKMVTRLVALALGED
jgi:hypothetical protein